MDIDELKRSGWIIMDAIVGSTAYGLNTKKSDVDTRGVFVLPMEERIAYGAIDRVADEKNNHEYWELAKFLDLLRSGNPQALELLNSPERCILKGKEYFDMIPKQIWVTRACATSYFEYAKQQLRKARGFNKKINKPQPERAPRVLDFCYVASGERAIQFREFLRSQKCTDQSWYALSSVEHMTDIYALYYQEHDENTPPGDRWANGVVDNDVESKDIHLETLPKNMTPIATLFFNRNAFSKACKEHTEYWKWFNHDRNKERYADTMSHGKGYDAKNVMHCIRLLMTAKHLAETGVVKVDWSNRREFFLDIKAGTNSFEDMMALSERLVNEVTEAFGKANHFSWPLTNEELSMQLTSVLLRMPEKFNRLVQYNMEIDPDEIE